MRKVILILAFFLIGISINAQIDVAKALLGGLTDQNREMVIYLRSMDAKMTEMELRNKKNELRQKTTPNPLLINSKIIELAKEKSETINIAKRLVSDVRSISKTKISNPDEVVTAIVNISQFTVQSYLQTKKLIGYSGEAIPTQDKLKVLSDTAEMIEKNKQQLLWVSQQVRALKK